MPATRRRPSLRVLRTSCKTRTATRPGSTRTARRTSGPREIYVQQVLRLMLNISSCVWVLANPQRWIHRRSLLAGLRRDQHPGDPGPFMGPGSISVSVLDPPARRSTPSRPPNRSGGPDARYTSGAAAAHGCLPSGARPLQRAPLQLVAPLGVTVVTPGSSAPGLQLRPRPRSVSVVALPTARMAVGSLGRPLRRASSPWARVLDVSVPRRPPAPGAVTSIVTGLAWRRPRRRSRWRPR